MPISAPPPSWASIKNKPNTVAGFGITDMGSQTVANATNATNASNVPWLGVSSKPTTVAGLGLSDFNASAIAAQAEAVAGGVGTYAYLAIGSSISAGSTYAGSSLNWTGGHNGSSLSFSNNVVSGGLGGTVSGTWRAVGYSQASNGQALFLRIS